LPSDAADDELHVYIDGASRGNPGPAGIGVVVKDRQGITLAEISEPIGQCTNNAAEYHALLRGLREAKLLGARTVRVFSDSELLVRQCNGEYKVKSAALRALFSDALALCREFEHAFVEQVAREDNELADRLARQAARAAARRPARRGSGPVDLGRAGERH